MPARPTFAGKVNLSICLLATHYFQLKLAIWERCKPSLAVVRSSSQDQLAAMTLPNLLLVELRLAFQTCARQHITRRQQSRPFRTLPPLFKKNDAGPGRGGKPPLRLQVTKKNDALPASHHPLPASDILPARESASSRELVPDPSKPTSVSGRRRVDVPMKIIPKAQVSPQLKLTPKEQLHIEFMTRRPPRAEAKKSRCHAEAGP